MRVRGRSGRRAGARRGGLDRTCRSRAVRLQAALGPDALAWAEELPGLPCCWCRVPSTRDPHPAGRRLPGRRQRPDPRTEPPVAVTGAADSSPRRPPTSTAASIPTASRRPTTSSTAPPPATAWRRRSADAGDGHRPGRRQGPDHRPHAQHDLPLPARGHPRAPCPSSAPTARSARRPGPRPAARQGHRLARGPVAQRAADHPGRPQRAGDDRALRVRALDRLRLAHRHHRRRQDRRLQAVLDGDRPAAAEHALPLPRGRHQRRGHHAQPRPLVRDHARADRHQRRARAQRGHVGPGSDRHRPHPRHRGGRHRRRAGAPELPVPERLHRGREEDREERRARSSSTSPRCSRPRTTASSR